MDDKPFVNENISFMVDSTGNLVGGQKISGIPNCTNGDCNYSVDESKAKQIAETKDLKKELKIGKQILCGMINMKIMCGK